MSNEVIAPARPKPQDYKPIGELRTVDEALKHPQIMSRFKDAVPKHLSTERMLRVCAMAVFRTPKLADCNMMSLLGAMLSLASLGLEPNNALGHSYLIPFSKNKKSKDQSGKTVWSKETNVEVVIGYRGLIDLARRSGSLVSLHADVVYEGDVFEFEYGSRTHLKHIPMGKRETPIWAYCHAQLTDGQAFEVMPYNLVLKIRNGSQGYQAALKAKAEAERETDAEKRAWKMKSFDTCPWVAFEHQMACKTLIRQVSKVLPMSVEFMRAVEMDELSEVGKMSFEQVMHRPDALENFALAEDIEDDNGPDDTGGSGGSPTLPPTKQPEAAAETSSARNEDQPKAEETAQGEPVQPRRGRPRKADAPTPPIEAEATPMNDAEPERAAQTKSDDYEFIDENGEPNLRDSAAKFANTFSMTVSSFQRANRPDLIEGLYETNELSLERLRAENSALYDHLISLRGKATPAPAEVKKEPAAPRDATMPDIPQSLRRTAEKSPDGRDEPPLPSGSDRFI